MIHVRTPRRRLAAAVTAVLAVTAAGLATPAMATTPLPDAGTTATATAAEDGVISFPSGAASVVTSGRHGFLSSETGATGTVHRWTRYADGVTTVLPEGSYTGSVQTDFVVKTEGRTYKLYDMATGADPIQIDASGPRESYQLGRVAGSTLVMTAANATGGKDIHLVGRADDTIIDRKVPGLPANTVIHRLDQASADTVIVLYSGTVAGVHKNRVAMVDIATGTIVEDRDVLTVDWLSDTTSSATHLAWVEKPTTNALTLAVARRGAAESERIPLGYGQRLRIELLGDWVTYGQPGGLTANFSDPLFALTARSLETGETVRLLDHLTSSTTTPDGGQLVRGGTVAQGEGFYRIAPGQDGGPPVAELVASTGEQTVLTLKDEADLPSGVIDFDRTRALQPTWTFSHHNAYVSLTVEHIASGQKGSASNQPRANDEPFVLAWNGWLTNQTAAYNGEYTWRMRAQPANGIGPAIERSGTFTLVRTPKPHDFNDNGSPDLLVREGTGRLLTYEGGQILNDGAMLRDPEPATIGTGWNTYDRVTAPGNIAGSVHADVLGRDRTGTLWLHTGNGKGLAPRTKIGGGWETYDKITGGSDLTGDGRPDLVAADKTGALWFYKATGDASAPFAPRKKVGGGWGIYNQLTAVGNIAGAPAGDLVARDKDGVLWLYLGKGDGTFAARTKIGGGWNQYTHVAGIGDTNNDGRPDLVAYNATSGDYARSLYIYQSTGEWRAPFKPRDSNYNPGLGEGSLTLF
ncbi:VCBS repeat-containing protein [Streptomyces sp. NPDC026092]|uniref:VCBS repeat-containing protein n=1 Tax=Streptomyces sp. NPDC026092 TaxID=3154797 RepID=UPI0033EC4BC9